MHDRANHLYRRECDRCGARLKQAKQKGKYFCEYCGAVYFDNNFEPGADWVAEEDPIIDVFEDLTSEDNPEIKKGKKSKQILILSFLIITICLVSLFIGLKGTAETSVFNGSSASTSNKLFKPEMLTTLPKAENAGEGIAFKDWEILVNPEFSTHDNRLYFSISIQNWSDENKIFNYVPNEIIVYDNLGNEYKLSLGNCPPDVPYLQRQIPFTPNEKMEFQSSKSWCSSEENIPTYSGIISKDVSNLYIYFKDFGVFNNITFVFDL